MGDENNIVDETKKSAEEISQAAGEASQSVADAVGEAADQAGDAIAEQISEATEEADETVAEKVAQAGDQAAEAVEEAGEAVAEASQAAADSVSEAMAEATPAEAKSNELDALVEKLKAVTPATLTDSQYSPVGLITLLQEYFPKLPADLQARIMDLFQGMDPKDLVSVETWKGVVTMVLYSAKAQAEQVTEMVDSVLPDPLKSSNLLGLFQGAVDKYTPSVVKGAASSAREMASGLGAMASNLEGVSAEDLVDPETWKGLYFMLDYGLRAQVTVLKERITGGEEEDE